MSVRLWIDRILFQPASPLGMIAARAILALQALWIVASTPRLPELAGWPDAFWFLPQWHRWRFGIFRFSGVENMERVAYVVLQLALIAAVFGIAARWSCLVSALLLYHFAPFEALVVGYVYLAGLGGLTLPTVGLFILAFAPQPRRDARWSPDFRWPFVLIQTIFAFNYINGGLAKFRYAGPAWYTPKNFAEMSATMWTFTQPSLAMWVSEHRIIAGMMSVCTFATEFLLPLAIVSKWARRILVPLAFVAWIVRVNVFGFFFLGFPSLLLFVNWDWVDRRWRRRATDTLPEAELAGLASRVEPPGEAVAALIEKGVDWKKVLEHAQMHGVLQFVRRGLAAAGVDVPQPWREVLDRQTARNAARALFQYRESTRIVEALARQNVEAIPFKGTALSAQIFGKVSDRSSNDIDILIRPAALPLARETMHSLGYEIVDPTFHAADDMLIRTGKDIPFINRSTGTMVEIHWKLFTTDRACGFATSLDDLRTENGRLSAEDTLLMLVHHGLSSRWEVLKWTVDIDAFVRNVPLDWNAAFARARRTGSARALEIALLLANQLLDTPLPMAIDGRTSSALADRFARGVVGAMPIGRIEDFRLQLRARERWIDRFRFMRMVCRRKPPDLAARGALAFVVRAARLFRESVTHKPPKLTEAQKIAEWEH